MAPQHQYALNFLLVIHVLQVTNSFQVGSSVRFFNQPSSLKRNGIGTIASQLRSSPQDDESYDCVIIGAGVVGAIAALTAAADSNRRVALVGAPQPSSVTKTGNDLSLGGPTGLFSKALRDTSKQIKVSTLRGMGLREDSIWNEITSSCEDLAISNAQDMTRQLEMAGVDYIEGSASFCAESQTPTISIEKTSGSPPATRRIAGDKFLLATGSKPFLPPGIPFDGHRIFDSDSINTLSYLPKSIAITGSGIIAVEFAKIFRNLGSEVTLIIRDFVPRNALMKIGLDIDVAAMLVADLVRSGIKIERGAQVKEFESVPPLDELRAPIKLTLEGRGGGPRPSGAITELKCDAYLAAVGRQPNTGGLNLESVSIDMDEYGGIVVDSNMQTSAPNIYAAGDVVGRPFLASTGVAQAKAAVNSMVADSSNLSMKAPECAEDDLACVAEDGVSQAGLSFDPASLASNPFAFPTGIWSSPEAAYYGFSKKQAIERGIRAGEGIALYAECLRGRVFSPNGLLKLVHDKDNGRILGVHICGQDACELIHYGMVGDDFAQSLDIVLLNNDSQELVKGKRTIQELSKAMFSAVTFHEMYRIAAQAGMDEAGARARRAAAGKALAKRNRSVRT